MIPMMDCARLPILLCHFFTTQFIIMKSTPFFVALLSLGALSLSAQVSYGPGAGTAGSTNSFFGQNAGSNATGSSLYNVAVGRSALYNLTTGAHNVAVGGLALYRNTSSSYNVGIGTSALYYNDGGSVNTGVGYYALSRNTTGNDNTALGGLSLFYNTTGNNNVAVGSSALYLNTTGGENTAIGRDALRQNTTGYQNVALGVRALQNNTFGYGNLASGFGALQNNTTGNYNNALGHDAMNDNTTGSYNVGIGYRCLYNSETGLSNVGLGIQSLGRLLSGSYNTATGGYSGYTVNTGNYNVALGYYSLYNVQEGSNNIGVGLRSGATVTGIYDNAIAIGYDTRFSASNQVRVGNSSMTSIGGQVGWTSLSDARFKSEVQEDVLGLDFINALRPVSYKVDRQAVAEFDGVELEAGQTPPAPTYHTGFLAQEVEKTAQALGFDRFDGVDAPANEQSRYGLRYSAFVVPLVKSVQELSAENETLRQQLAKQQAQIDALLKLAQQQATGNGLLPTTDGATLYQNAPNPFSETTTIRLSLPDAAQEAALMVTNLEGRQLFAQRISERGDTQVDISAKQLPAGLYLYTLVVDGTLVDTKKMLITE